MHRRTTIGLLSFGCLLHFVEAPLDGAMLRTHGQVTETETVGAGVAVRLAPEERAPEGVIAFGGGAGVNITLPPDPPPFCAAASVTDTQTITIDASDGELPGGCVRVRFCHEARFTATRTTQNLAAEGGYGGPPVSFVCGPGQGTSTQMAIGSDTRIILDPNASPQQQYSAGPLIAQIDDPQFDFEVCDEFSARVGDEIQVLMTLGTGGWGTGEGTLSAFTWSAITFELLPCPLLEIPALDGNGLLALAALLAVLAFAALARRRRRAG